MQGNSRFIYLFGNSHNRRKDCPLPLLACVLPFLLTDSDSIRAVKTLSSVQDVRVVRVGRPRHRIIHILDWYYVEKELFVLDIEHTRKVKLTPDEAEQEFPSFLKDLHRIQYEQMHVLRYLQPRAMFSEGPSEKNGPAYHQSVSLSGKVIGVFEVRPKWKRGMSRYFYGFPPCAVACLHQVRFPWKAPSDSGRVFTSPYYKDFLMTVRTALRALGWQVVGIVEAFAVSTRADLMRPLIAQAILGFALQAGTLLFGLAFEGDASLFVGESPPRTAAIASAFACSSFFDAAMNVEAPRVEGMGLKK